MTTPAPRARWWTFSWFALAAAFLAVELPAAKGEREGTVRTLSRHVWIWFPGWAWWSVIAAFCVTLALHLSPLHMTVWPVVIFGALIVARVCWAEFGRRRPGDYLCVDKEPRCWHRTWLGAWVHRVGFRERRLP